MPLSHLDYPAAAQKSDIATAVYELALIGWSNDLCSLALLVPSSTIESELKAIRDAGNKIERPANTQVTYMHAIGIAAIVSRNEFHMLNGKKFKTGVAKMEAQQKAVARIAKSLGRSQMWVRAMIRLYREHVIKPAREEIDGGKNTVAELVKAA